jgi:hypothetical protein
VIERSLEALLLGLSVGLVCLASCGAVLVPWLVVQQRAFLPTAWLLGQVLAGRLAGYLLFACAAWTAGALLVPGDARTRVLVFGLAHLALAAALFWYAFAGSPVRHHDAAASAHAGRLPSLRRRVARLGPAALGFLTGVTFCPPFVVATVRAAELRSLPASLAFFTLFFLGTSVWFLPFLAAGVARRIPEAHFVARIAMGVVGAYYGYMGVVAIGWRVFHE